MHEEIIINKKNGRYQAWAEEEVRPFSIVQIIPKHHETKKANRCGKTPKYKTNFLGNPKVQWGFHDLYWIAEKVRHRDAVSQPYDEKHAKGEEDCYVYYQKSWDELFELIGP